MVRRRSDSPADASRNHRERLSEAGWWISSACSVDAPRSAAPQALRVRATDITALGDSIGDMLTSPVRDAPPMARAAPSPRWNCRRSADVEPPRETPRPRAQAPVPEPTPTAAVAPRPIKRPGYLAVHSVEKSFGSRQVVRGVSIYVRRGEAVGLLGPNGAGKTTVFYMITGLIKADRGAHRARRPRRHQAADVSARAARHRLSAAGSLDLSRPHRRAEHPRRARGGRARAARSARPNSTRCSRNSTSRGCANRPRSRCRAASAAASRSRARWRRGRTTCCSTSRSPASIRSRSATFRIWCAI